jgi:hypothetical protein
MTISSSLSLGQHDHGPDDARIRRTPVFLLI